MLENVSKGSSSMFFLHWMWVTASQADQNQAFALPWTLAININLHTFRETRTWTREVTLKKRFGCYFNNWKRRDSQGRKIAAVCPRRGHKPKSNGKAPTSARPEWPIRLQTSLMWFWMEQQTKEPPCGAADGLFILLPRTSETGWLGRDLLRGHKVSQLGFSDLIHWTH